MAPSRMMSVWFSRAGAPVPSITRTCVSATTGVSMATYWRTLRESVGRWASAEGTMTQASATNAAVNTPARAAWRSREGGGRMGGNVMARGRRRPPGLYRLLARRRLRGAGYVEQPGVTGAAGSLVLCLRHSAVVQARLSWECCASQRRGVRGEWEVTALDIGRSFRNRTWGSMFETK